MSDNNSVGMVGLGVMGANLARNIERNGFPVVVYNRTESTTDEFLAEFKAGAFQKAASLEELVEKLAAPRRIILMIKAGKAVDSVLTQLLPILEKGDVVVDGGNALYTATDARVQRCAEYGVSFLGAGISGGEEGALHGPSIMPGGPREAWEVMAPVLEKIAANADGPCVAYIGPGGAGHFVKMVHNGIEYGYMQLIAEIYDLLRCGMGLTPQDLGQLFSSWNSGPLNSYLVEITASIFEKHDESGNGYVVDSILDVAGQKGTGRWTVQAALELGIAVPTLSSAVFVRNISAFRDRRIELAAQIGKPQIDPALFPEDFPEMAHGALLAGQVLCFAQGMELLQAASSEYDWNLQLDQISRIWRAGCIIRSALLGVLETAYQKNPTLDHLLLDGAVSELLLGGLPGLRAVVRAGVLSGIPVPALSASLAYLDLLQSTALPLNLLQAQRDYFGSHTFKRLDQEGTFHVQWAAGGA